MIEGSRKPRLPTNLVKKNLSTQGQKFNGSKDSWYTIYLGAKWFPLFISVSTYCYINVVIVPLQVELYCVPVYLQISMSVKSRPACVDPKEHVTTRLAASGVAVLGDIRWMNQEQNVWVSIVQDKSVNTGGEV